jgi:hypothetical protein
MGEVAMPTFFAGWLLPFGNSLAAEIHGIVKNAEGGEPLSGLAIHWSPQGKTVHDRLPAVSLPCRLGTSNEPTLVDQRHDVIFASYRLTPSIRLGVQNLYGSGFPFAAVVPNFRLSAYERLDLRVDKSWLMPRGKFSLYGELLNATNHYNPVFEAFVVEPNGLSFATTSQGVPITPTVGIAFDF